jgi:hypothetical protein
VKTPRALSRTVIPAAAGRRVTRRQAMLVAGAAAGAFALPASFRVANAQDATPTAVTGPDYPETIITAVDYAFGLPATIPGGWNRITMRNAGEMEHHAMLMALPAGSTWEAFMEAAEATVADFETTGMVDYGPLLLAGASYGGPGSVGPDYESSVVLYLDPGEFAVVCAIPAPDGMPHYQLGMMARVTVTDPPADAITTPPEADAIVELVDFAFSGLPADLPAGPTVWQVTNSGAQVHEIVVLELLEGIDPATALAMLSAPPAGAENAMLQMDEESGQATPAAALDDAAATPMTGGAMATPAAGMDAATPMTGEESATPMTGMEMEQSGMTGEMAAAGGPPFRLVAGVAPMNPGATNWMEFDLESGDYLAICFIPDPESGMPHFLMGMAQPFTVS